MNSLLKYTTIFNATRWVMLYMKDELDFFSPTHLQALDFVLLKKIICIMNHMNVSTTCKNGLSERNVSNVL